MGLGEKLMKLMVKMSDVVELARRFRAEPLAAMQEVAAQVRAVVADTLEQIMDAEIDLVRNVSTIVRQFSVEFSEAPPLARGSYPRTPRVPWTRRTAARPACLRNSSSVG